MRATTATRTWPALLFLVFLALVDVTQAGKIACHSNDDCRRNTCVKGTCTANPTFGDPCDDNKDCKDQHALCILDSCSLPRTWKPRAYCPIHVTGGAFLALDQPDQFLLLGGVLPSGLLSDLVFTYNATADSWKQKQSRMRTARIGFGVASVAGKVFVVGGEVYGSASRIVEEFDPVKDEWRLRSPMPSARSFLGLAAVAHKIYAVGGQGADGEVVPSVEEYDVPSDSWSSLPSLPAPRSRLQAVAVNGLVFALGGVDDIFQPSALVEVLNPISAEWSAYPPLLSARSDFSASVVSFSIPAHPSQTSISTVHSSLLVFGGRDSMPLDSIEEFSLETHRWKTRSPLPSARTSLLTASFQDGSSFPSPNSTYPHVLVLGGIGLNHKYLTNLDLYRPSL